jgi:hypothetical protein
MKNLKGNGCFTKKTETCGRKEVLLQIKKTGHGYDTMRMATLNVMWNLKTESK